VRATVKPMVAAARRQISSIAGVASGLCESRFIARNSMREKSAHFFCFFLQLPLRFTVRRCVNNSTTLLP
jgi:hypothetical protein